MKRSILLVFAIATIFSVNAQKNAKNVAEEGIQRPKLVVGIVVDQMRWDYLYRFNPLFKANGGFKRMMGQGFSCDNTLIPYTPTITACGHACTYTGSVPSVHGIAGNAWWDNQLMRSVYCTEDRTVKGVGGKSDEDGQMSPRNMLTTTICDELRLATNFQSKVIGIALKDRGAILPAGHSANGAYWYEGKSGNFITSTYYMNQLPDWVNRFNNRKLVDSLYQLGWSISLPKEIYSQYSTADNKEYESKPFGRDMTGFPYDLAKFIGKDYSKISSTPSGNTLTVEMAKAAVLAENLGRGPVTDFLAVSFSSPDYIGHSFGPNSWEMVDDYVRLDEELGRLFAFLDATVGKNQYTAFLTADHAVSNIPGFLKENKLPGGVMDESGSMRTMNAQLKEKFGIDSTVVSMYNYQVHLNHPKIDAKKADEEQIKKWIIQYLKKNEAVTNAFATADIMTTPINKTLREMAANGFYPTRSGDIQFVLKPGYIEGGATGTTHGSWYPYDAHIPLLWYGWGIKKGKTNREIYMTDIAPTVAALLNIQMPSGNVGKVIEDVMK
ncbi:MAG: alkaline phosphatase family protein [Sediminibacterium sp.]|nr:alkaline phosphatase family protein [Sediminibacterium sp.]